MMNDSIHAALWEWFLGCALITKLFFNFSDSESESTAIATSGDTLLEEYIDGSQIRRYAFELIRYLPATFSPNDPGNVDMMEDVEAIVQWVQTQSDSGNFPALPEGCEAESVAVLEDSAGYVAAQDQDHAKYMIPFAITYRKG